MKMLRSIIAGAALCAAAALPLSASAQEMTLRMGTFATADSPWGQAMRKFKEGVEGRTDGRIEIAVYTDGQLGDMQQLLTGMQLGTIDMAYFDVTVATFMKGAEALSVAIVPYLFDSKEDASRIMNSEVFRHIYDDIAEDTGVRIFAV